MATRIRTGALLTVPLDPDHALIEAEIPDGCRYFGSGSSL